MKSFNEIAAMLLGIAFAVSCQKPVEEELPDPVFPSDVIEATVQPGGSYEISFTANYEWEIALEGAGAGHYFWILDNDGFKVEKLSGEVGDVSITIYFSEEEELDVNRVCVVNLTMASQTQKIAEITRFAKERTFSVSFGIADEEDFRHAEGGSYVYDESSAGATLVSFAGSIDYSIPVKVVSNYDWVVAFPDWATSETKSGKAGVTEFVINAVLSAEIVSGADGILNFYDEYNTEIVNPVALTMPSFSDRLEFSSVDMTFNKEGQKLMPNGSYQDVPAVCYVLGMKGFVVKAIGFNGESHDQQYAEWVNVECTASDAVLQKDMVVEIKPEANPGITRMADILIFPASMAAISVEDICDDSNLENGLKADYQKYYLGRLVQEGEIPTYITLSDNPDEVYEAVLNRETESWLFAEFEAEQAYTLTYSNQYSESVLIFNEPFASYKLFDYDTIVVPDSESDSFWITFNPYQNNTHGKLYMDPKAFDNPVAEKIESFIAFYDETGKCLAVVDCIFDEAGIAGGEDCEVSIVMGNGVVSPMSNTDDYYMYLSGEYGITSLYDVTVSSTYVQLTLSETPASAVIYSDQPDNNGMLPEITDGSFELEGAESGVYISVSKKVSDGTGCIIVMKNGNNKAYCALHFIYDSSSSEVAPFSFVNPDSVNGATLEKYTGNLLSEIKMMFGVDQNSIYLLTYSTPESTALIKCPCEPKGQIAWNNCDATGGPMKNYWLTCEMSGSDEMYVYMSEAGKYDYFVFQKTAQSNVEAVLVCTCTASSR